RGQSFLSVRLLGSPRGTQRLRAYDGCPSRMLRTRRGADSARSPRGPFRPTLHSQRTAWSRARSVGQPPTRRICVRNVGHFFPLVMAGVLTTALSAQAGSPVVVLTTLDTSLAIFDADPLGGMPCPVPSSGGG